MINVCVYLKGIPVSRIFSLNYLRNPEHVFSFRTVTQVQFKRKSVGLNLVPTDNAPSVRVQDLYSPTELSLNFRLRHINFKI